MTHTAVSLLQRLQLGDVGPTDARILADVAQQMLAGRSAEEALNLPPGWQRYRQQREKRDALASLRGDGEVVSRRAWALQRYRELSVYAAGDWRFDRDRTAPRSASNIELFRALKASAGRVPSIEALRKT